MDWLLEALRAVAEPTRLRLLVICAHAELTVGELVDVLGQSQPRVSRHLKLLCGAGLLERFREQHHVYYRTVQTGKGQRLWQALQPLIPTADGTILLDRSRVDSMTRERARRASHILEKLEPEWQWLRPLQAPEETVNRAILDQFAGKEIGELLDIGTGTGRMLKLLGTDATRALGVDISPEMLLVARSRLHGAGLSRVSVRHGDMYHLPFPDASFATIVMDRILSQAEHPRKALLETARLLKPGGRLLIVDFESADVLNPVTQVRVHLGLTAKETETWLKGSGMSTLRRVAIKGKALNTLLLFGLKSGKSKEKAVGVTKIRDSPQPQSRGNDRSATGIEGTL